METESVLHAVKPVLFTAAQLPDINLQHVSSLTDQTGIIQHAVFAMPNRKEGYCIDDNSRALLLAVWASKDKKKSNSCPSSSYLPELYSLHANGKWILQKLYELCQSQPGRAGFRRFIRKNHDGIGIFD